MTNMAMSVDFLSAFARLPGAQQRNVRSLITRFSNNPTASGLNYERINGARDPNMRSLRIDPRLSRHRLQACAWRRPHAVVGGQARRGVPMGHAPPLRCASRKPAPCRCICRKTMAVQKRRKPRLNVPVRPGAFASLKDRELMRLGVPAAMLPRCAA